MDRRSQNQYILFTWSKCKQCQEMKKNLRYQIQTGIIREYDLDTLGDKPTLMRLFNYTSPHHNVPALAVISNGIVQEKHVGIKPIMTVIPKGV